MGILQSTARFLTSKPNDEEEEVETPIHPDLQNHYISSSERFSKLLSFPISIYKALKFLIRRVGFGFAFAKLRKPGDPLLPVQNPASSTSTEPLLAQTSPISSPITAFSDESVGEERWIKHYSSRHRILLVGDGDFSFSACLAVAFGSSATNIIATSLDSIAFLKKNYGRAMSNIAELRSRGSKAMHEIDATEIANHELLRRLQFDRIIFNFPFAGFFPDLSPECQLRCHRSLVSQFLENAKDLLSENGEIHVSHKTNGRYHGGFKLESIAASRGLRLIAAVEFKCSDYPGYNTKYGFGGDKNFNCYPSKTFKFGFN
ncbi:hypothetical protein C2S51_009956 [Perilla frutescens var. frutescens]|nr:hypothetical protein C2S51_009956 [Perilla frutescens var. frutescens]